MMSQYLDRLKKKSDFESPSRELTKLTKPENRTSVSLVSSPNGHSKSHFSEAVLIYVPPPAHATRADAERWMDSIGEFDPVTRREYLEACGFEVTP